MWVAVCIHVIKLMHARTMHWRLNSTLIIDLQTREKMLRTLIESKYYAEDLFEAIAKCLDKTWYVFHISEVAVIVDHGIQPSNHAKCVFLSWLSCNTSPAKL